MARRPNASEVLAEHYKGLDKDECTRQGQNHLHGNAALRAQRALHRWRTVALLAVGGALLLGIAFVVWLFIMAKATGQQFAEVKQQAIRAYLPDE